MAWGDGFGSDRSMVDAFLYVNSFDIFYSFFTIFGRLAGEAMKPQVRPSNEMQACLLWLLARSVICDFIKLHKTE